MTTPKVCPWCSEPVQASAIVCPHCGRDPRQQPMQRRPMMQVVVGLFALLGLGMYLTGYLPTTQDQGRFLMLALVAIGITAIATRNFR